MSKLLNTTKLKKVLTGLKRKKKKVVITNGCFDIIHPGHIEVLRKSKKLGDVLIVLLNSDKSVKKLKGKKRPIINQDGRIEILDSIKYVDFIVLFNELTPVKLYKKIKPNFLTKGSQYSLNNIIGKKLIEKNGGKIKLIKMLPNISTTLILKKISKI